MIYYISIEHFGLNKEMAVITKVDTFFFCSVYIDIVDSQALRMHVENVF